jgi:hypothetical protein
MTTNDNGKTGWSSDDFTDLQRVNLPLTTMTTIFSLKWVFTKLLGNSSFFTIFVPLKHYKDDMKGKHCIFLLLILGALLACNDPKPITETLHRAEALMNEHPDSAFTLLQTLDIKDMQQKENRALYALLYTQAQDKNYIDETNDSLITLATEHYRQTDDVRHKFLSFYYKGRVHFNTKDYLNATTCYMEAEQLADEVEDDYLVGLLYAELGRIYNIYYDFPKSLEAHQKAAECYERAGKIRHRNYMWYNQSNVYRNLNHYKESEHLLQMAMDAGKKENDNTLIRLCMGDLIMLYIERDRIKEASMLYHDFKNCVGNDYGTSSFLCSLAQMYVAEQDYKQAEAYIKEGWNRAKTSMDSVRLYLSSSELVYKIGNEQGAYEEFLKGISLQKDVTHQTLQQPILTAQRDYLSDKLEFEAYRLQTEKHLRILYILFFTLLLLAVVYFLHRKLKKEKEKARQTIDGLNLEMLQKEKESREKISTLLQELEDKDKTASASIHHLRNELLKQEADYHRYMEETQKLQHRQEEELQQKRVFVADLFKQWCEVMGLWACLYEDQHLKASDKLKSMGREVGLLKDKYMVGSKAFRELERLVNTYHEDAMHHFRREVSLPDEADYRRVCYYFAGFSIPTIAWLMDEKVENIYQRRLRLRKNVSVLDSPHRELFLLLLCK